MPAHLKRYWLAGKGALKIRWGMPGDFMRCVHNLRKYFPKDPKGLCANLHHDALAKWPGREHPHRLAMEEKLAQSLLAAAPLGPIRWMAPLAPINKPTGDGRQFTPGSLSFRRFPLPLSWIKTETSGHQGRTTVGRILGATIGPDEHGQEYAFGFGDFFSPNDIPEVSQALALVRGGVVGISLDPGGLVRMSMSEDGEVRQFTSYKAGGGTLVSIPAFEGQYMLLGGPDDVFDDDETDEYVAMADHMDSDEVVQDGEGLPLAEQDCGCGDPAEELEAELAVNSGGWRGLPIAARETPVDRDDALKRIAAWANGDASKLNRAFLWRHPQGEPGSVLSYRLPVGDIIGGKLTMVYHAIYAASALLEGAHGGLPNIPDSEKDQLRRVISAIYKRMATDFNDPDVKASWDRAVKRDNGVTPVEKKDGDKGDFAEEQMPLTELSADVLVDADEELSVNASGWSGMPIASAGTSWDEGVTRRALDGWAGDDLGKYGRAFLWRGDTKSNMKFPIATIIDGKLTIVPRAVSAALGRLNQADLPNDAKGRMRSILMTIRGRFDDEDMSLVAVGGPVTPPASWFEHQEVATDPGIKVSAEGQVTGYLAAWKQCHMSVGRGRCVKAPRSQTGYQYFHLGSTAIDSGDVIKVGRLTVGGGHADVSLGVIPATEHYDNAGTVVAVVRAHEDGFGIQVAGAIVPGATAEQVAALRRSPLSGDWRAVNRNLELVAALAVNVPGFPVFAEDEEGHEMALISSGFAGDPDDGADHEHDGLVTEVDGEEELAVDVDELVGKVISTLADQEAAKARAAQLARQQQVQAELEQSRRAERLKALTEVN
jgi:hypothetical protein